jgi:hypothetical protein
MTEEVKKDGDPEKVLGILNYVKGDATAPQGDGLKLVVHCCNNIGAWGAGFVMAISNKWPAPYEQYFNWMSKKEIEEGTVTGPPKLGECQFVPVEDNIIIVNMVGQEGTASKTVWPSTSRVPVVKPPIRYEAIQKCLQKVAVQVTKLNAIEQQLVKDTNTTAVDLGLEKQVEPISFIPVSVHCPKFGCGLAGGKWDKIEPLLISELIDRGINVTVYTI